MILFRVSVKLNITSDLSKDLMGTTIKRLNIISDLRFWILDFGFGNILVPAYTFPQLSGRLPASFNIPEIISFFVDIVNTY